MAFAHQSPDSDWLDDVKGVGSSPDTSDIPASLRHYSWASRYCVNKSVTELNCRAGFGIRILSDIATKCTGIDRNREAIKYAMRNFFVEGKNRFVISHDEIPPLADSDVVISFNTKISTPSEFVPRLLNSLFLDRSATTGKTLILGTNSRDGLDLDDFAAILRSMCSDLSLDVSFYQQRSANNADIEACTQFDDGVQRAIAVVSSHGDAAPSPPRRQIEPEELVSIVIPTYNRADLISESIESALGQTYPNIEVIVIDDGSTDNTREVVKKYGDRIRYYEKKNGGIGSGLNFGIKKMNGKWFKWLSSDDVLTPDAVETLLIHARESGAMILYTDYDIIDEQSKFIRAFIEPHFTSYYEFASALWTRFIGNGSSSLIDRSCFEEVGLFDEIVRSAEDYDWWLRACLLHGYRFLHIPRITLKYRTHGKQLTAAVKHNAYTTDEKIRRKVKEQIIAADPEWWETLSRYQKLFARQNETRGIARRLLRKSLMHMPEGVRKSAMGTWQRSIKPKVDDVD
jgi:glycosyltransferase involved in cell wall biosynthesis